MSNRFQQRWANAVLLAVSLGTFGWLSVFWLAGPPRTDVRDPAIRESAEYAAWFWLGGACFALSTYRPGRSELGRDFRTRRVVWTAGCVLTALHIAVAMHAGHGWSHEAAYRHTEAVGGFGWGVYVNYAFLAVWLADVLWMWLLPTAYRLRPRWIGIAVHGFLAFVVFNATVVFGTNLFARLVALLCAAYLVKLIIDTQRKRPRTASTD